MRGIGMLALLVACGGDPVAPRTKAAAQPACPATPGDPFVVRVGGEMSSLMATASPGHGAWISWTYGTVGHLCGDTIDVQRYLTLDQLTASGDAVAASYFNWGQVVGRDGEVRSTGPEIESWTEGATSAWAEGSYTVPSPSGWTVVERDGKTSTFGPTGEALGASSAPLAFLFDEHPEATLSDVAYASDGSLHVTYEEYTDDGWQHGWATDAGDSAQPNDIIAFTGQGLRLSADPEGAWISDEYGYLARAGSPPIALQDDVDGRFGPPIGDARRGVRLLTTEANLWLQRFDHTGTHRDLIAAGEYLEASVLHVADNVVLVLWLEPHHAGDQLMGQYVRF